MLVPEAILQTDYGAPLREALASSFRSSLLVYVRDRMFADTDEAVVAVACRGFGESGDVLTSAVDSVEELQAVLKNPDSNQCQLSYRLPTGFGETGAAAISVLSQLEKSGAVRRLSDVADIRIGVVTGANRHFIRSATDLDALGLPQGVRHRVVPRTRWLKGLEFTEADHDTFLDAGLAAQKVPTRIATSNRGFGKAVRRVSKRATNAPSGRSGFVLTCRHRQMRSRPVPGPVLRYWSSTEENA